MRKLTAVGVVVGMLLAGAGLASAAPLFPQGGTGDPLQLPASGVFLPFIQGGPNGLKALVEVASPVGPNCNVGSGIPNAAAKCTAGPDLHLIFFLNNCARQVSTPLPETENDIAFVDPNGFTAPNANGLVLIGGNVAGNSLTLQPFQNPIHTRVYEFNPIDGRSRVLEPVVIDTAEFGSAALPGFAVDNTKLWSPLRTAATFYAPFEGLDPATGLDLRTQITFICPRDTIQGGSSAPFGSSLVGGVPTPGLAGTTYDPITSTGFPQIYPPFWTFAATQTLLPMAGTVFDVNEGFLADITFGCDCLSPDVGVNSLTVSGSSYSVLAAQGKGTYTELFVAQKTSYPGSSSSLVPNLNPGSFSAYRDVFSNGSALNKFFGRMSDGSVGFILGVADGTGFRIQSR